MISVPDSVPIQLVSSKLVRHVIELDSSFTIASASLQCFVIVLSKLGVFQ